MHLDRLAGDRLLLICRDGPIRYSHAAQRQAIAGGMAARCRIGMKIWESSFAGRQVLSAHMPETHLVRADNSVNAGAEGGTNFCSNRCMDLQGSGHFDSAAVGRPRLRRLIKHGEGYVAKDGSQNVAQISRPCPYGRISEYGPIGGRSFSYRGAPPDGWTGWN